MNGAEALIKALFDAGVEVCFANPGTSELQLVTAFDSHGGIRPILGLFEGVVTGAADGYGRMAGKPAATLLHLGPGFANGMANLHNAHRARTPVLNIVGDHATYHLEYDAPLTSDVRGFANLVSGWVQTSSSADGLARQGAEAIAATHQYPGKVATLIAPADHSWGEAQEPCTQVDLPQPPQADESAIDACATALKSGEPATLFLGGMALREGALFEAGRIAAATGARLICETFPARLQRGAGRVPVERLPYFGETALEYLQDFKHLVLVGAKPPVSFFAYPGKPSWLSPENANCPVLATPRQDPLAALRALADKIGAPAEHDKAQRFEIPPAPRGALDPTGVGSVVAELMPENAVVSDEAVTAGLVMFPLTAGARAHDWMTLTGGAIGQGLPLGLGAAVACPDRKTICLQADGSGMYTVQALWTMARENLDVTTVILNNGSYAILNIELQRVGGADPGPQAHTMINIGNPAIDWVSISQGMGVPAERVDTVEDFRVAFADALAHNGPRLVEAVITP